MYNMIKLDWSAMKYYHPRFIILPLCLIFIGWYSPIGLVPLAAILMFSYSVNPFAVEEKGDLNRLYLSLPVKRSTVVAGRYCLSLLMFLAGLGIGFGMMPLANLISVSQWYPDLLWRLSLASFSFLIHGVMSLSMYPVLFRLGYQKGKFWGFYLPAIFFALTYVLLLQVDRMLDGRLIFHMLVFASEHMLLVCGGMLVLGLILLAFSFLLSLHVYAKREL